MALLPVVVLISGRGSNMRALAERSAAPSSAYRVTRVLSDQPLAAGLEVARELGIEARVVPVNATEDRRAFDRRLAAAIDEVAPSLIVLAGFMRILSAEFIDHFADRVLNIHPSLLPKYPGLHTHRKVLAAGDAVHGATVHFVTAELDAGPRVLQARVPVLPNDDEATLAARVQRAEHHIYPLAVDWYARSRLRCHDGHAWLDGNALRAPVPYESVSSAGELKGDL